MTTRHCDCSRARRDWRPDGTCARCRLTVHESSIMDAVKAILVQDPKCLLWRNEIGSNTHWPNGEPRKGPIRYGVCNPGGADLIGLYSHRFLAVETKTVIGTLSPEQIRFGRWVADRQGVYAVCRSEQDAAELLTYLHGGAQRPAFVFPEHP